MIWLVLIELNTEKDKKIANLCHMDTAVRQPLTLALAQPPQLTQVTQVRLDAKLACWQLAFPLKGEISGNR